MFEIITLENVDSNQDQWLNLFLTWMMKLKEIKKKFGGGTLLTERINMI